ncbi:hypothetical protein PM082_020137 [Marasmius tenuissimus]|nr:hypothetical protein PM082_020137 [Marasmius tenuissimus]
MGVMDDFTDQDTVPAAEAGGSTSEKSPSVEPFELPPIPVSTPLRTCIRPNAPGSVGGGFISPLVFTRSSNPLKRSSSSLEDPQQTRKKLKEYAEKVSDVAELNAEDRQEISELSQLTLHEAVISLHVKVAVLNKRYDAQHENYCLTLITGRDFKNKLQIYVNACLLAPDLSAYLSGPVEAIMSLIQREPDLFGVPKELLEYSHLLTKLRKQVVDDLSTARGNIRNRILASLEEKDGQRPQPMNELAKALATGITGMEIQTSHWARFSFLRCCQVKFAEHLQKIKKAESSAASDTGLSLSDNASTTTSAAETNASSTAPRAVKDRYQPSKFWNWVDDHLVDIRLEAFQKAKNQKGQEALLGQFFQRLLAADLKQYTGPGQKSVKPPPDKAVLHWQQKFTVAMVF